METNIETVEPLKKPPNLSKDILRLLAKIGIISIVFILLFTFVFGWMRYQDNSMSPAIKNGDMVLYYRLDKKLVATDVVVLEYEGKKQIRRVVAVAGDTIDITEEGLFINGSLQQELAIYTETLPYVKGINFPVTLQENEVFLLADNRTSAIDSRMYGPVNTSDILGKVISIFRRRGI